MATALLGAGLGLLYQHLTPWEQAAGWALTILVCLIEVWLNPD